MRFGFRSIEDCNKTIEPENKRNPRLVNRLDVYLNNSESKTYTIHVRFLSWRSLLFAVFLRILLLFRYLYRYSVFYLHTVPLTFSFTRYSNDIRTIIDWYTNGIPFSTILLYNTILVRARPYAKYYSFLLCLHVMPNYSDILTEPYSVFICLNSPVC